MRKYFFIFCVPLFLSPFSHVFSAAYAPVQSERLPSYIAFLMERWYIHSGEAPAIRKLALQNFQKDFHILPTWSLDPSTTAKIRDIRWLMTLTEKISDIANLSTFATAFQSVGVESFFHRNGPYTIFAPNNIAFAKIPDTTLGSLLVPSGWVKMHTIIDMHIISGIYHISDLYDGERLLTLNGSILTITIRNGKMYINGAEILIHDIDTENGVLQIIDTVIMP